MLFCIFGIFIWGSVNAQDDQIFKGKLENGLEYYLIKDNSKKVSYTMYQKAGSSVEEIDERGLSHMIEHVTCQCGTNTSPRTMEQITHDNQISNYAKTYRFKIEYALSDIDSHDAQMRDTCINLLHDWICGLKFQEKEIDFVRSVIYEEWRTNPKISPYADEINQVVYNGSPYMGNDNLGDMDLIKSVSIEKLKSYYNKWFNPMNIGIAIVGDIDIENQKKLIKEKFGSIKSEPNAIKFKLYEIPDSEECFFDCRLNKRSKYTSFSIICRSKERICKTEKELCKQEIYAHIFHKIINKRLETRLVQNYEQSFIQGSYNWMDLPMGYKQFGAGFTAIQERGYDALKSIMAGYQLLIQKGLTIQEIGFLKNNLGLIWKIKPKDFQYRSVIEKNYFLGQPLYTYDQYSKFYDEIIDNFNNQEFITYCKRVIKITNPSIFIVSSQEDVKFTKEKVYNIFNDVNNTKYNFAYELPVKFDNTILTQGNKILSKKDVGDVRFYKLSNGLEVVYKKYETDDMYLEATSKGGLSIIDDKDLTTAEVMVQMHSLFGYGDCDEKQLNQHRWLNDIKVQFNMGEVRERFRCFSPKSNFEECLKTLMMSIKRPKFDELNDRKKYMCSRNVSQSRSLFYDINNQFNQEVYAGMFRLKNPKSSDYFNNVDPDRAVELFKYKFDNAADWKVMVMGKMNHADFEKLMVKYLGSLDNKNTKEEYVVHYPKDFDEKELVVDMEADPYSNEGGTNSYYAYFGKLNFKEEIVLKYLEKLLTIRSLGELRLKLGGVYNVHLEEQYLAAPTPLARIDINFGTDKKKLVEYLDRIDKQFKDVSENVISNFEFNAVKRGLDREEIVSRSFITNCTNSNITKGVIDEIATKDYFDEITAKDIQQLAQKIYDNKQVIKFIYK